MLKKLERPRLETKPENHEQIPIHYFQFLFTGPNLLDVTPGSARCEGRTDGDLCRYSQTGCVSYTNQQHQNTAEIVSTDSLLT